MSYALRCRCSVIALELPQRKLGEVRCIVKKWKTILATSAYSRLLLVFSFTITVVILSISTSLFYMYSIKATKEIANTSIKMLKQTSYSSDILWNEVVALDTQLSSNSEILAVLFASLHDPVADYHASLLIRNIESIYPFVDYISIYNGKQDYTLSRRFGVIKGQEQDIHSGLNEGILVPRNIQYKAFGNARELKMLSFRFVQYNYLPVERPGSVIIHVKESYLRQLVQIMGYSQDNVFVIEPDGRVLTDSDGQHFMENFASEAYIENILDNNEKEGDFIELIQGEKSLVTFAKSEILGWVFVRVEPVSTALGNLIGIRNLTWIISALMILLGSLFAIWYSKHLFLPIHTLMKSISPMISASDNTSITGSHKNRDINSTLKQISSNQKDEFIWLSDAVTMFKSQSTSLESKLQNAFPLIRESQLRSLLMPNSYDMVGSNEMLNWLKGPYYKVFLLSIDRKPGYQNINPGEKEMTHSFIIHFFDLHIPDECNLEHCYISDGLVAFLVQSETQDTMLSNVLSIKTSVSKTINFDISYSISFGTCVDSPICIPKSFCSAQKGLGKRFFLGNGCVIDADDHNENKGEECNYPILLEQHLLENILEFKSVEMLIYLELFMRDIQKMSYSNAISSQYRMLITLEKQIFPMLDQKVIKIESLITLQQLEEFETLDEMWSWSEKRLLSLIQQLQERKKNINQELSEKLEQYLISHYHEYELTQTIIAEQFHLSARHLNTLYKSWHGNTISSRILDLRLHKAKDLLVNTGKSVQEICMFVGMNNATYFSTVFKRIFKMTPLEYRKINLSQSKDKDY